VAVTERGGWAMAAAKDLAEAIEQAKKVLGEKAVIPPPKNDPDKLMDAFNKATAEFEESRDDIEAKLLAMENAVSAYKNGMKQNAAIYQRADFDLDDKSKDDVKKIKQAQKIFNDFFASDQSDADKEMKLLDELDKHVIQLNKHKPSL
jgi:exonuclease VII small subunit